MRDLAEGKLYIVFIGDILGISEKLKNSEHRNQEIGRERRTLRSDF